MLRGKIQSHGGSFVFIDGLDGRTYYAGWNDFEDHRIPRDLHAGTLVEFDPRSRQLIEEENFQRDLNRGLLKDSDEVDIRGRRKIAGSNRKDIPAYPMYTS